MKKFLVFISVLALISLAACAFATSGGHVDPDANVNTTPAVDYEPAPEDVTGSGAVGLIVELIEPDFDTPSDFTASKILLPTATADKVAVMTNIKVNVKNHNNEPVTISFANYTDSRTTDLYAFIEAHTNVDPHKAGEFSAFACTVSGNVLSFTVDKPQAFFSENVVVLATAKTVSSGGSSGGCNTGYAGLLLLAVVPLFFRKK